jgi:hypothetical protein
VVGLPYIALGNGDGTFRPRQSVPGFFPDFGLPPSGVTVAAGDFTGDGNLDLVSYQSDGIVVGLILRRGRGDGTFDDPVATSPGLVVDHLIAVDLNHDGHLDLVTKDPSPAIVQILVGRGDGSFEPPAPLSGIGSQGFPLVGDIDGDGRGDLLVMDGSTTISIRRGLPDGTLSDPAIANLGLSAPRGVAADFDGDGCADLAIEIPRSFTTELRTLRGRCDGTWDAASPYAGQSDSLFSDRAAGDLNGDGRADLAVVTSPEPVSPLGFAILSGYLGHPDGSFAKTTVFVPGADARAPVVRDGRPDAVLAGFDTDEILVTHGLAEGGFGNLERVAVGHHPGLVAIGDLNGDGRADLVASHDQGVSVSFALPGGGYEAEARLPGVGSASAMSVLDLDGDGIEDLALQLPAGLSILLGRMGDLPQQAQVLPIIASFLGAGDFNGDGRPDLGMVTSNYTVGMIAGGVPAPFQMWTSTTPPLYTTLDACNGMTVGDFNEDGRDDMTLSGAFHLRFFLLFSGQANGTLVLSANVPMQVVPGGIGSGDFDRDGHLDLVVGSGPDAAIYRGDGMGGFASPVLYSAPPYTADVDGDGRPDLLYNNLATLSEDDRPPVAIAAAAPTVECTSPSGATVTLDGSASHDPDSTPGSDDIASYAWYENYGLAGQALLGNGATLELVLPLGAHAITLVVTDRSGESATATVSASVVDTTPPTLTVSVLPYQIWPANHQMVTIHAQVWIQDACGTPRLALLSVTSSEPDDSPGGGDGQTTNDIQGVEAGTPDVEFLVRAEREAAGPGRTYTATYEAIDASGNSVTWESSILILANQRPSPVTPPRYRPERVGPPIAR